MNSFLRQALTGIAKGLALVAVVYLLCGMPVACSPHSPHRDRVRARMDMRILKLAVEAYANSYDAMPWTLATQARRDVMLNDMNSDLAIVQPPDNRYQDLLNCLAGTDSALNPKGIIYLDLDKSGSLLDPWGNPYMVVLDLDYDGALSDEQVWGAAAQDRSIVIWSMGSDGEQHPDNDHDTNHDNIYSWE